MGSRGGMGGVCVCGSGWMNPTLYNGKAAVGAVGRQGRLVIVVVLGTRLWQVGGQVGAAPWKERQGQVCGVPVLPPP